MKVPLVIVAWISARWQWNGEKRVEYLQIEEEIVFETRFSGIRIEGRSAEEYS